jgi:hypothetical protein
VEFEDGLYISVLKNRATRHQILQREIEKFPKVNFVQRPPAHFDFFEARSLKIPPKIFFTVIQILDLPSWKILLRGGGI